MGNRTLAEYTYSNDRNRQLLSLDCGNDDNVQYTYDKNGRVTKLKYEDNDIVTYTYDNAGSFATVTDSSSGISSSVIYDFQDRLSRYAETGGDHSLLVRYKYESENRISAILYMVDGVLGKAHNSTYTYDSKDRIQTYRKGNGKPAYTYDLFGRTTFTQVTHSGNNILGTTYGFAGTEDGKTSNRIDTLTKNAPGYDITYHYEYDQRGNIIEVWHNDDRTNNITYVYDSLNQLIREDNKIDGYVREWTYDNAGNIEERREFAYAESGSLVSNGSPIEYEYNDEEWGDLLTKYNGQAITYDAIGNPISMGGKTFQWEHGRELASLTEDGKIWNFTYNADGLRTQRTNGTKTYDYVYCGNQLMYMQVDGKDLLFSYTPEGVPMGITYLGTAYYYLTNLQGDVVGILNNQGERIVSYSYDAWGNILATQVYGSGTNRTKYQALANYNPLRYRGYVYDVETKLYYLQSRYYYPEAGRFLNTDTIYYLGANNTVTSYNLYAYCENNPINMIDSDGCAAINVVFAAVGGVAGWMLGDYVAKKLGYGSGTKYWAIRAGVAVGGAVIGWFSATLMTKILATYLKSNPTVFFKLAKKLGISKFHTIMNFLGINPFSISMNSSKFIALARLYNSTLVTLSYKWAVSLYKIAKSLGYDIILDEPHGKYEWHIHLIGANGKLSGLHIQIAKSAWDYLSKLLK